MFNEQVAMMIYNDVDTLKKSESFENFKGHILHGLELLKSRGTRKYMSISDVDRRDLDLAIQYNIELMSALLMQ